MDYSIGWDDWQLNILDDYILGYTNFNTQQELADYIGKSLNAIKVKLSRRKEEIVEEKRKITEDEYVIILANRFDKETPKIANFLNLNANFILEQMDEELDCLECKEFLEEGFRNREVTNDEYELFIKLYAVNKRPVNKIAHILNREIRFIEMLIKEYEKI